MGLTCSVHVLYGTTNYNNIYWPTDSDRMSSAILKRSLNCGGGEGTGGREGYGDGRRKGGKRERISKRQAFVICYCLHPVKETNPATFLDFHLTFSEAWRKILYTRKVKKRKIVLEIKKKNKKNKKTALLPVKLETFPSRLHHRTWMR